jgi:1-acyl-sn-glycerol-3-phosphate acyltransferase
MWLRYILLRPVFRLASMVPKYNLQYTGDKNAPGSGPFIVICNHQTNVDGFAIALALHRALNHSEIVPWAKVEIGQGKEGLLGWVLWRIFPSVPIDRANDSEMVGTIRQSLDRLRKGSIVLVFPEGTRYPHGELGPFKYGVANLARSAPAPILPVALWRREEDGGVQVNIGKPFFMPNRKTPIKVLSDLEDRAEDVFSHGVDVLKQWSEQVSQDRRGMKVISSVINVVVQNVEKQRFSFDVFCRMAEAEDNRYLQDKVMELLPDGWRRVTDRSEPPAGEPQEPQVTPEEAPPGDRDDG